MYGIVRKEITRRTDDGVDDDWAGWIDYNGGFLNSQEDVDAINRYINIIVQEDYPIHGTIRPEGTDQRLSEAKKCVSKYGINDFFTKKGSLNDIFLKHYGQSSAN